MKFNAEGNELLELGRPPLLIEPVRAKVTIAGRKVKSVHVLDHDGRRTEVELPVAAGAFSIDGARDRSFYYDVELD